jgi:hypothetical protein
MLHYSINNYRRITVAFAIFFSLQYQIAFAQKCTKGDCENGFGEKLYPDSSRFNGQFEKGQKKCGSYYYASGNKYTGCFDKNKKSGFGIFTYTNKEEYKGIFKDDQKVYGEYKFSNGEKYHGSFMNNLPDGMGSLELKNGKIWEGQWKEGKKVWGGFIAQSSDSTWVMGDMLSDSLQAPSFNDSLVGSSKSISPRLFTVVVGISDYEGTELDLNYSDDDAQVFYKYLQSALPREMAGGKSILLLNQQATVSNISSALSRIFSLANENDFIMFYFSGHGTEGNFVPYDYLSSGLLDHELIKKQFKQSKAKYRICIADACNSGSIGSGEQSAQNTIASSTHLRDARIAIIMSSKSYQNSAENGTIKQGVFTYCLVNGLKGKADLNGDSYVNAAELFIYTKNSVVQMSNGNQVPVIFGANLNRIPLARVKR